MESDEGTAAIGGRELRARIEDDRLGSPVAWEGCNGRLLRRASADLLAIAAVLGRQDRLSLLLVMVAVRPAEIVSLVDLHHDLGRKLRALLGCEAPVVRQLVATVLHAVNPTGCRMRRQCDDVSQTGRVSVIERRCLMQLVRVEPPDACTN